MADIRINALATTAASTASDDFLAVDGTTNGTRKLNAYSPTFGGNVVATGTLTVNSTTDSSSKDTGAIVTEGGLGVEKSATIGGNLTVSGTGNFKGGTLTVTNAANTANIVRSSDSSGNVVDAAFKATGTTYAVQTTDTSGNLQTALTLDSSQNATFARKVQVGTSSVTGAQLVVVGPASASARTATFRSVTAGDTSYSAGLFSKYDNDSTTSQVFVQFSINNDTAASGQINANGASQAAFGSWSDARLKKNIVSLGSQWNAIKSLRPVEFDYIESEGGGHQIGFIAQEVQPIYSDVVGTRPDGMFTLSGMGKNEARLIKALQEAMLRIEALEAKLA